MYGHKLAIVSTKIMAELFGKVLKSKTESGFSAVQNSMKSALGLNQVCFPGEQTILLIQNC